MAQDCSAAALDAAAVMFKGISDEQMEEIITWLLCQWANK